MVFYNKKMGGAGEPLPSDSTTYTSPTGQRVAYSPPVNKKPVTQHKYVNPHQNPDVSQPCRGCHEVSPPVKKSISSGLTTDDYVYIGVGALAIILIAAMVI